MRLWVHLWEGERGRERSKLRGFCLWERKEVRRRREWKVSLASSPTNFKKKKTYRARRLIEEAAGEESRDLHTGMRRNVKKYAERQYAHARALHKHTHLDLESNLDASLEFFPSHWPSPAIIRWTKKDKERMEEREGGRRGGGERNYEKSSENNERISRGQMSKTINGSCVSGVESVKASVTSTCMEHELETFCNWTQFLHFHEGLSLISTSMKMQDACCHSDPLSWLPWGLWPNVDWVAKDFEELLEPKKRGREMEKKRGRERERELFFFKDSCEFFFSLLTF